MGLNDSWRAAIAAGAVNLVVGANLPYLPVWMDRIGGMSGAEIAGAGTLVNMVAGGLGVSLLPKLAVDHGLSVGSEVAVRDFVRPVIGRQIGIAWRSGSPREADARKIGEVVKTALAAC